MYRGREEVQRQNNEKEGSISRDSKENEIELYSEHLSKSSVIQQHHTALAISYTVDIVKAVKQVFPTVPEEILKVFVKELLDTYGKNKKHIEELKDFSKRVMEDISESGRTRTQAQKNFIDLINASMELEGKVPEIISKWVKVFTKQEEEKVYPTININIKPSNANRDTDDFIEVKLEE